MLVRQKTRFTVFSSEDSKNTDNSLGSSLEVEESNAQASHANKFNQLRETMNQIFLANPELADEIKFDKYLTDDEPDPIRNFGIPTSPLRRGIGNGGDPYQGMLDEPGTELASGKFWSTISKEMTKAQKNSKAPTLNQINHVLNIFKGNWEKQDDNTSYNPVKSPSAPKKSKSEFRIQSAKGGEKQTSPVKKEGKGAGLNQQYSSMGGQDESEDGMKYYSFRKKLHLKLKHKRIEREMEELARKKELDAEKEKLAKELEERQMLSTLAGLDQEIKKGMVQKEGEEGEGTLKKEKKKKEPQSRRNSSKPKGDIFERLTKDMTKNVVIEEEENQTKRKFVSEFAEDLYKDLKAIGDAEVFKKVAQTKIANRKKEWKERLAKQKLPFNEALRFTKNKSRYLNMFVPEAEKIGQGQNKDAVFVVNEVQKDSEEWKLNFENEVLAKIKKIKQGNILEFWQEVKDINQ